MSEYGFFIGFFLVIVFLAVTQDEQGRGYFARFATSTPSYSFVGNQPRYREEIVVPPPQTVTHTQTSQPIPTQQYFYVTLSDGSELLLSQTEMEALLLYTGVDARTTSHGKE